MDEQRNTIVIVHGPNEDEMTKKKGDVWELLASLRRLRKEMNKQEKHWKIREENRSNHGKGLIDCHRHEKRATLNFG